MLVTPQPGKRGLRTLHCIPAVRFLGVILLEVVVPVRPMLRRLTGPPPKPRRTSMLILPPVPGTDAPEPTTDEAPDHSAAC